MAKYLWKIFQWIQESVFKKSWLKIVWPHFRLPNEGNFFRRNFYQKKIDTFSPKKKKIKYKVYWYLLIRHKRKTTCNYPMVLKKCRWNYFISHMSLSSYNLFRIEEIRKYTWCNNCVMSLLSEKGEEINRLVEMLLLNGIISSSYFTVLSKYLKLSENYVQNICT